MNLSLQGDAFVERGTSAVLIRVTRVPADWSATVTQVQVGLR